MVTSHTSDHISGSDISQCWPGIRDMGNFVEPLSRGRGHFRFWKRTWHPKWRTEAEMAPAPLQGLKKVPLHYFPMLLYCNFKVRLMKNSMLNAMNAIGFQAQWTPWINIVLFLIRFTVTKPRGGVGFFPYTHTDGYFRIFDTHFRPQNWRIMWFELHCDTDYWCLPGLCHGALCLVHRKWWGQEIQPEV